ncbi:hypothetical protein TVAG_585410 [Trichomonas vaginalis G3]|uniref:Uncharacterized protein n=1 Tax=Trichomonas vaginalis (strain ATCC PRA-98 / G3) TaxID=412133 RepID=A2GEM3_TRIV3|nr:hypothetical protein TVAGG3_0817330 [Trichomonas vaginalis G3]EAX84394.1 hypothetical protein TVAG_585410 [Trichomonas vaginalis G3]KAI5497622.1 hypothetical protein TVAGG3_0817330 [Trichomonas vaginalis G3]|eukprot:XP_001297324.1 hypothetical protein [Trichomonas vaginalis G3]
MNENETIPFPYNPQDIRFKQTSSKIFAKEGVKRPIDPYAWITSGTIKEIEKGLPLLHETQYAQSVVEVQKQSDNSITKTKDLLKAILDDNTDEELSLQEMKQQAEEERRQKLLKQQEIEERKRRNSSCFLHNKDSGDIISNIGTLNFKTIKKPLQLPEGENPFPEATHMKSFRPKMDSTIPIIKQEIKKSFKYGFEPFEGIETDEDFPIDGLMKPDSVPPPAETPVTGIDDADELDKETPSLLIDPYKQEIFWSKTKAPFTREEVNLLYTMRNQSDLMADRLEKRFDRQNQKRIASIRTTFQSRKAFMKRLDLIHQDIDRITNIGPGKGLAHVPQSPWVEASQLAMDDNTSLPYRKKQWQNFVDFIAQHGYISNDSQQRAAMNLRHFLMSGDAVDEKMFWNFMDQLSFDDFTVTSTMLIVEYLRRDFGVTMSDVVSYLQEKKVSTYFYDEACQMYDSVSTVKKQKKRIMVDPEHCDAQTLAQLGIWEKTNRIKFPHLKDSEEYKKIVGEKSKPKKKTKRRVSIDDRY